MSILTDEEMLEIIEVVCMTVLDLPVDECSTLASNDDQWQTASIRISGAWTGVVHMKTTTQFLTLAASHVFVKNETEIVAQDRADTAKELTNMIGGTVKVLLPEICDLALPEVADGAPFLNDTAEWSNFSCAGHPIAITLVEAVEDAGLAA